jgi:signal transduction histidine kinase
MTKTYGLLETLLDWGRIQQGKIQVNPQKINLKQVVDESLELFEEKCTSKMIEMSININDTIEPYTDKCSLETVIRNLVSNAVKYTHQSGKIYIEAEELGGNKVMVSIKDNGIGMNKEIVDNLFHFDIKSNRPGLDGEQSVGLGLIISKELIENQGGIFEVESEVDCGTTFKFTVQNYSQRITGR